MSGYVFTDAAENDLDGIVEYTRQQWDDRQARRYVAQLRQCLNQITTDRGGYRIETVFARPVRVLRCQHHYIFCVPRGSEPALIVAILHEKMDLVARITERL